MPLSCIIRTAAAISMRLFRRTQSPVLSQSSTHTGSCQHTSIAPREKPAKKPISTPANAAGTQNPSRSNTANIAAWQQYPPPGRLAPVSSAISAMQSMR